MESYEAEQSNKRWIERERQKRQWEERHKDLIWEDDEMILKQCLNEARDYTPPPFPPLKEIDHD